MIQLQTFGALDVVAPDGRSLEVVLAQPKRALLLAYLACATPRGYQRRDVIVTLFWPELDAERARAALRQSLHFLRSSIGEALVTRGDEVAIDPLLLTSDVAELERAVDEGRLIDAVRLYRGEFLPGVFVREAPEIERWIAAERARLARIAESAAWTLAERSATSDPSAAAGWAAVAARIAPGDEGVLRRRMSLLHRIGDRSGAMRAYDDFIATLQRDYPDTEPSLETRDLRDAIVRAPTEGQRPTPASTIKESSRPGGADAAVSEAAGAEAPSARTTLQARRRHPGRIAAFALVAVGLAATVAATIHSGRDSARSAMDAAATSAGRTVAVMPFTIRGGSIDYLRHGMVDLLSMSLDGAGDLHTVEPTALLGYLAHDSATAIGSFEQQRATALRFNAGTFVVGTIVDAGSHLEARAALYATSDSADHPLTVATASSDEAHVVSMVDQLARGLVAGMLRSSGVRLSELAAQTTTSLPALKSYLRGTQAMRTGQYDAAIAAFTTAVSADSTFALAFYGLSMARGWASGGADRRATIAAQHAVEHASGLSAHDSLLLVAHYHNWNGRVVEAEQEYRRLLAANPNDAEAWHELGEVIFHNGAIIGHAIGDARDAFTRIANIDPLRISALTHLARIAAIEHDSTAIDTLAALTRELAPADPRVSEMLTLRTFVTGDSAQRQRAIRDTRPLGDHQVWILACDVANYAAAWRDAESIAMLLTDPARPPAVRALGWTTIAQIRAAAGRPAAARVALAAAAALDAAQAAYTRGFLAGLPFLPASSAELDGARAALVEWREGFTPFPGDADAAVSTGAVPVLRRMIASAIDVRAASPAPVHHDSLMDPWTETAIIAAMAQRSDERTPQSRRADIQALERVWQPMHSTFAPRSASFARLARADLLRAAGEDAEAERWYSTFPAFARDDAVFRAWAAHGRARVMAARGDRTGAARVEAEATWLWRDAEPSVAARLRIP